MACKKKEDFFVVRPFLCISRIKVMPEAIYQFMEKEKYFERGNNSTVWRIFEPDTPLCEVVCFNRNSEYPKLVELPESFKALYTNPFDNMKLGVL